MKKFFAFVLTCVCCISLGSSAYAAELETVNSAQELGRAAHYASGTVRISGKNYSCGAGMAGSTSTGVYVSSYCEGVSNRYASSKAVFSTINYGNDVQSASGRRVAYATIGRCNGLYVRSLRPSNTTGILSVGGTAKVQSEATWSCTL